MRSRLVSFGGLLICMLLLGLFLFAGTGEARVAAQAPGGPIPGPVTPGAPDTCDPAWRPVDHPDMGQLYDVLAIDPSNVYVGGLYGLIHWDGISWNTVLTSSVHSLAGLNSNDVWASSYQSSFHWDGSTWSEHYVNLLLSRTRRLR